MLPFESQRDKVLNKVKYECAKYLETENCFHTKSFVDVACALAVYIFHDCPNVWNSSYEHEKTIVEWTVWIMMHSDVEELQDLVHDYKKGLIPDAFSLMKEYIA
ncbi:MAG TPA: hypothetical protein VLE02_01450 [Nitrosarchaeum sp.]|nr:hypothetical protein [Nitrosarchaeum sp.]